MSSNLKVNKRSQKSFSVTRFSGFDGSRVQITTARDHRKELDFTDKFFTNINLNKQEAQDLVETLMGFINNTDNECFDSVPLVEAEKQWMDDFNKVKPGTARVVTRDNGIFVERPTFTKLLQENQEKVSQNDKNYFDSRRMA